MANTRRRSWIIGIGLLLAGAIVAYLLVALAPSPPRGAPPPQTPLVETVPAKSYRGSLIVQASGTVEPVREIDLTAEVRGQIIAVDPSLASGGSFEKGQVVARIDPSDYRSAVQQAEAAVTQAQFQLIQARQESEVARREYERLQKQAQDSVPTPDSTQLGRLVFKEPQLHQARANLESAQANLATTRNNLRRTKITAPFNGRIRTKHVDLGAYVAPGTPVVTIYGTDMVEIVLSLSSREAALIEGLWNLRTGGSSDIPATVTAEYGGHSFSWSGYVDRVEGAMDTQTRTVDVVVRVPRPFDQKGVRVDARVPETAPEANRPPLQIGQFATVEIHAQQKGKYLTLPRRAVRIRERESRPVVWTVRHDSMLVERPVQLVQTVEQTAYLTGAIEPGTPVIVSDLQVQTDSMRVRMSRPQVRSR